MSTKQNLKDSHPDIAAEWHPTKNGSLKPEQFTPGSAEPIWWECKNGHEWNTQIKSRTHGSGCPYCKGQKV